MFKKIIIICFAFLFTSTALADQEFVFPPFLLPPDMNAVIAPPAPPPQIQPQKPLVKKVKWIMTPNITFVEAPYYTRGMFGGVIVKKQIVMNTTWVWTPVEVWE